MCSWVAATSDVARSEATLASLLVALLLPAAAMAQDAGVDNDELARLKEDAARKDQEIAKLKEN
ncbi:MAG: hypothetical protein PHU25_15065, partial [Deltaproteobacteria bacterium]|nr:hypothetical protein [Deltaproteobacteria bacterium]